MVPLTSSSEAEGVLGRVAGMGPSALLEGLEEPSLKAPSASLNSSLPGSQNFLSKLELALGHDRTSQLKVAGSRVHLLLLLAFLASRWIVLACG